MHVGTHDSFKILNESLKERKEERTYSSCNKKGIHGGRGCSVANRAKMKEMVNMTVLDRLVTFKPRTTLSLVRVGEKEREK